MRNSSPTFIIMYVSTKALYFSSENLKILFDQVINYKSLLIGIAFTLEPNTFQSIMSDWEFLSYFYLGIRSMLEHMLKSLQSCPTLCDPMDCSLSDSSVQGILQKRVLEWVAISSDPGTEPKSCAAPALQVISLPLSCWGSPAIVHRRTQDYPIGVNIYLIYFLTIIK